MIVFSAGLKLRNCQIYVSDDDGDNLFCVTGSSDLEWCQGPILSPDRKHLAFYSVSLPNLTQNHHIINLDGSNLHPLPVVLSTNMIYSWLPNGKLFFISERKYWTAYPDGSNKQHETFLDGYTVMGISSDGHLAVITKGKGIQKQIFVADLEGRTIRSLFTYGTDMGQTPILYPVALSPDNQKIACVGGREDEIWVVNVDGSNSHMVAEADYFWLQFNWSPDSKHIVFVKHLDNDDPMGVHGGIHIVGLDSLEQRFIADVYKPGGKWCWSRDGKRIVYTTLLSDSLQIRSTDMQGLNRRIQDVGELGFDDIYDLVTT